MKVEPPCGSCAITVRGVFTVGLSVEQAFRSVEAGTEQVAESTFAWHKFVANHFVALLKSFKYVI
jgi:L-cystine uptake protein TcyP (sodium:dicarboxylate symporter family)